MGIERSQLGRLEMVLFYPSEAAAVSSEDLLGMEAGGLHPP